MKTQPVGLFQTTENKETEQLNKKLLSRYIRSEEFISHARFWRKQGLIFLYHSASYINKYIFLNGNACFSTIFPQLRNFLVTAAWSNRKGFTHFTIHRNSPFDIRIGEKPGSSLDVLNSCQELTLRCKSHVRASQAYVGSPTDDVHSLFMEHTRLDRCASRWTQPRSEEDHGTETKKLSRKGRSWNRKRNRLRRRRPGEPQLVDVPCSKGSP